MRKKTMEERMDTLTGVMVGGFALVAFFILLVACNYVTDIGYRANNADQRDAMEKYKGEILEQLGVVKEKQESLANVDSLCDRNRDELRALLKHLNLDTAYQDSIRYVIVPREKGRQ